MCVCKKVVFEIWAAGKCLLAAELLSFPDSCSVCLTVIISACAGCIDPSTISKGEFKEFEQLLNELKEGQTLGRAFFVHHQINTGDTQVRQPPRRPTLAKLEKIFLLLQKIRELCYMLSGALWFPTLVIK